jgi:LacI family transcriptional regulator
VSRVAAGQGSVAEETRARVMSAMAKVGYQPNAAARAMRTNVSKTIGLLIPDIRSPTFIRVAAGAEEVLAPAGYMLLSASSNRSIGREVAFLQAARQRQMDGLIVSTSDETAEETLHELNQLEMPLVILDRAAPANADLVASEHMLVMQNAVQHLIALGHRRIGFIGPTEKISPGRMRVIGYRRAHAAAGIPVDERLLRTQTQNSEYGQFETHDMMSGPNPPTALIPASSDIFYGALRAIRMLDLRIPEALSVIGVDDVQLADLVGPPITVILRDVLRSGQEAARLILERLRDPDRPPRQLMLDSHLVLRQSTAAPSR